MSEVAESDARCTEPDCDHDWCDDGPIRSHGARLIEELQAAGEQSRSRPASSKRRVMPPATPEPTP